jgi:hypothetical protein
MSKAEKTPSNVKRLRGAVFAFACLLGGLAVWLLAAELARPAPAIEFPTDAQSAASIYTHRNAATVAAKIGIIRGDLWAEAAFAYGGILWNEDKHTSEADTVPIDPTRELTEQAIAYAPHDSRLWLLLAGTQLRFDWLNNKASASLRMSYYTGSNTLSLIPRRLMLAIQSQALRDEDFQDLVRHDIHVAVIRKSQLKPALVNAYNNAPPFGRQFFEKALAEFDPGMLASIRSEGEHP